MQSFDISLLDEFLLDGIVVPRIRMYTSSLPDINIQVGDQPYLYDHSCPIKGHSAILPGQIRLALTDGKQPLIIERPERFYIYFSADPPDPEEGTDESAADAEVSVDEADAPEETDS